MVWVDLACTSEQGDEEAGDGVFAEWRGNIAVALPEWHRPRGTARVVLPEWPCRRHGFTCACNVAVLAKWLAGSSEEAEVSLEIIRHFCSESFRSAGMSVDEEWTDFVSGCHLRSGGYVRHRW